MNVRTIGFRRAGAVGAVSAMLALSFWPTTAQADVSSFSATAEAYPFRSGTTNPSFPLGGVFEGYGPYASTNLTGLGASDAVAAGPFPGPIAVQGPGLVNSVTGVQVPNYPFYVQTGAGEEPKHVDNPFSSLSAASTASVTTAEAVMGSDFSGATARARSEVLDLGGVRATAESSYEVLELANNIEIRGLRSTATATADAFGELTRSSLLEFDAIAIPGFAYQTPCTVPPQVEVPENQRELPCAESQALLLSFRDGQFLLNTPDGNEQAVPVDASALKGAFKALGVTMTYQEPVETERGIVGAGMTFESALPAIPPNESGVSGVTTQRYEIGFASASAHAVPSTGTLGLSVGPAAAVGALGLLFVAGAGRARAIGE